MAITENKKERINGFVKMVEIKKAIRKCIQNGGNLSDVQEKYGIKFVKPF